MTLGAAEPNFTESQGPDRQAMGTEPGGSKGTIQNKSKTSYGGAEGTATRARRAQRGSTVEQHTVIPPEVLGSEGADTLAFTALYHLEPLSPPHCYPRQAPSFG